MTDPMRLKRALLALDGLSVGDSFGERFFHEDAPDRIARRALPVAPWNWTDDTAMAIGITDVLARHGRIDQDDLAGTFARNYSREPWRGYGGTAHAILRSIASHGAWRAVSASVFNGTGSMGNGSAMRIAPLAAYFADDVERVVEQARLSAEVTHLHPEGIAGAIATAVAVSAAWQKRDDLLAMAIERTPEGETREGLRKAASLDRETSAQGAAFLLGNGSKVCSPDTVPFALWCAQNHLASYEEAMWFTVSGLGDRDTTCAIVGGIVALRSPIPAGWLASREPLPLP